VFGALGFEAQLLDKIADYQAEASPVGIAITQKWAEAHPKQFEELRHNPKLKITWLNHSSSHPYVPGKRDEVNFFTNTSLEDFRKDLIQNEVFLLKKGEIPSVLYRFPGLISTNDQIKELQKLNIIPIGSKAWLAIGEKFDPPFNLTTGPIVLVHGNRNEHKGVEILEQILEDDKNLTLKSVLQAIAEQNPREK
jgi:peptidoglycan/xylan/chitin deacetylase (PgdA/CDA1 family)